MMGSEQRLDLVDAFTADALFAEVYDVVCIVAKFAGRMVLLQNDAVIIGEDLKRILFVDVHDLAQRLGKHDAAQLVNLAYDSGRFHISFPFHG